ncbi:MAG: GTPase, partial [Anaerolineaceae bacterium]|nr:GTPase [Anaerolineaceae bacterium]
MNELNQLFEKLPPDTQQLIRTTWESLPKSDREQFLSLLSKFPANPKLARLMINLAVAQARQAFGKKQRVAILGPSNVGKSTLYNQFIRAKSDIAIVSPLPGTTRSTQTADAGIFTIIDTPGADAVGVVGEREQALALAAATQAELIIILFDAIQGIKKTELELFERIVALKKPYVVVINKIDLVPKHSTQVVAQAATSLHLTPDQIIPISAKSGQNLSQVLSAIAATEPEIVAALGRAMPAFRWQLAWRAIVSAASFSAVIAFTPLPFIDFAPLIITQSVMVLGIARIYDYKITLGRAKELGATFGLGLLGRSIFYQLSKFGGPPGWLLASAIAASTTVV